MYNLKQTLSGTITCTKTVSGGTALFKKIVTKKFDITLLIQMQAIDRKREGHYTPILFVTGLNEDFDYSKYTDFRVSLTK